MRRSPLRLRRPAGRPLMELARRAARERVSHRAPLVRTRERRAHRVHCAQCLSLNLAAARCQQQQQQQQQ